MPLFYALLKQSAMTWSYLSWFRHP